MSLLEPKYFKPTNWAIDHKVPVYILTIFLSVIGFMSYMSLPKEQFPDIVIPTIVVQTIHAGNSTGDIENLITRPIEKQLKAVSGIKKVTSTSLPDVSVIIVEFNTDVDVAIAKQKVNDAVDKSKTDLPQDLTKDPVVAEIDFSEFPIMNLNIYGSLEPYRLKEYADDLKDKIETMKEITRVDIIGAPEREFQVDLDLFKVETAGLGFDEIERAITFENVNISGGEVVIGKVRRNIRLISQFKSVEEIRNIQIKTQGGGFVYLKDIATVTDGFKEQLNFARLNGQPVISMNVIKKSGQNLIDAADKIGEIVKEFEKTRLPKGVKISITGDMSQHTRTNLADLINSVVIGFVLVVLVLMFFLGVRDSIFVGLSVPIASFLAILLMPSLGFTFNVIVTFGFLLALGIIVDDAIVVIENTHRLHKKLGLPIREAARQGAGEVFVPVLSGTLTTLAPFFPLLFFPGIVGKFMFYLPAVLILTLTGSLVVAYIFNPVLAVEYMHVERKPGDSNKNLHITSAALFGLAILFHMMGNRFVGNLFIFFVILGYLNRFFITPVLIKNFQEKIQPAMMNMYQNTLAFAMRGKNAYYFVGATFVLLISVFVLFGMFTPKVLFFSEGEPNYVYTFIEMPIGTNAVVTDSVAKIIEKRITDIVGPNNPAVNSIITNVGIGAGDPQNPDRAVTPHKAKVTVSFKEFAHRKGVSTSKILDRIRDEVKDYPGVKIKSQKENMGPPTGKPVQIEIGGDKFEILTAIEHELTSKIKYAGIEGIEKLESDLQMNKPEIRLDVDKSRSQALGISAMQIGLAVRTALYGKEATKFKDDKDEYPVQLRLAPEYRQDINTLLNMPITLRDNQGQLHQYPISSVVNIAYINSYESIKRKNQKRTITLSSNILTGFSAPTINTQIQKLVNSMKIPDGYTVILGGEQEQQKESSDFLGKAFMISIFIILLILITQFNSLSKPLIILSQVLLSTIGVLLGFVIFQINVSIVLTGIGIIALAGIVVRNGIVLIDFIEEYHKMVKGSIRKSIILGGATRFNPVVLTASATVLGVIPLAIGFNINFVTLFSDFDPKIFIGGDSVALWGPLAWAIVFGLTFATFLTLIIVPCIYFIEYAFVIKYRRFKDLRKRHKLNH